MLNPIWIRWSYWTAVSSCFLLEHSANLAFCISAGKVAVALGRHVRSPFGTKFVCDANRSKTFQWLCPLMSSPHLKVLDGEQGDTLPKQDKWWSMYMMHVLVHWLTSPFCTMALLWSVFWQIILVYAAQELTTLWTWSLDGIKRCFQQLSIKIHFKHVEICYAARCTSAISIQADHLHRFAWPSCSYLLGAVENFSSPPKHSHHMHLPIPRKAVWSCPEWFKAHWHIFAMLLALAAASDPSLVTPFVLSWTLVWCSLHTENWNFKAPRTGETSHMLIVWVSMSVSDGSDMKSDRSDSMSDSSLWSHARGVWGHGMYSRRREAALPSAASESDLRDGTERLAGRSPSGTASELCWKTTPKVRRKTQLRHLSWR